MTKAFSFATIATVDGPAATVVVDDAHYRIDKLLPDLPEGGLRPLIDEWRGLMRGMTEIVGDLTLASPAHVTEPALLAPLLYPNKLICVGGVYRDHLEQFDLPAERWPRMPIFMRPPTTSIVGPGRTVRIPPATRQFDWEIELAVVIGDRLTGASDEEARDAIAGYSIGIDFTCRDLLDRHSSMGVDLIRAKAQDGMAPLGPVIAPAAFVGDPQQLGLRLLVNGVVRQDSSTSNMLYPVYEQVATISQYITLEPGDVVFTGSPAGSAMSDDDFLKPGDHVRAEIEKVGVLELELLPPRTTAWPAELETV